MKKVKVLSFVLGAILLLGLPLAPMLFDLTSDEPAPVSNAARLLEPLLARQSALEGVYRDWQVEYVKQGGDRHTVIGIGWARGMSNEFSTARGRVDLDMIGGRLTAEVQGLDFPADVWLLDNQDAPGKTVIPEAGDRMVRLGRLAGDSYVARAEAELGEGFFDDFELDLVVVTRAGKTPLESSVLFGTRSFFERLYTKTRLTAAREQESGFLKLLSPRSLVGMLSPRAAHANSSSVLVAHGLVSQQVALGGDLFFRGTFSGNGRTCATCHPVENNQHLDVDFIDSLPANDKLFVAEFPVSQGGVPGLERPVLMRQFALILENVDGAENPTVKFAMRGVPHSISMATSIIAPVADGSQRTGWSGDGAPSPNTLRLFPAGATFQHFTKSLNRVNGVDFVLPTDAQLDAMEAFMLACGRTNELNLASVSLTDANANAGKALFLGQGRCNGCHGNAGANVGGVNRNFDTGVETLPLPARAVENHPFDGGFGVNPQPCAGNPAQTCFGDRTFNATPLIEAADTAPFFHNNVIETVEGSVAFYTTSNFANSPSGQFLQSLGTPVILNATEIDQVGAFLRVINAGFNMALGLQRTNAAMSLENSSLDSPQASPDSIGIDFDEVDGKRETVNALLALSNAELLDAIEVLSEKGLHGSAVTALQTAVGQQNSAINEGSSLRRGRLMSSARTNITNAKASLGTGLNFTLGEGNLMF